MNKMIAQQQKSLLMLVGMIWHYAHFLDKLMIRKG